VLPEGVRRIVIPTPFVVGPVNAWLLDGEEATLVDTGPLGDVAWEALAQGLGEALGRIRHVVVTHGHADHHGLAARVVRRTGAEVRVHGLDRDAVERFGARRRERRALYEPVLASSGLDDAELGRVRAAYRHLGETAEDCDVAGTLAEGNVVEAGAWRLEVLHTPGHTPGSVTLREASGAFMLGGDTLLERITSNAISIAPDEARALSEYRASLERLAATRADLALPGHGDPFADHARVARSSLEALARRQEKVRHLVRAKGPLLARDLFPHLFLGRVVDPFLAMSETLGHLRLAALEGALVADLGSDGRERWRAA